MIVPGWIVVLFLERQSSRLCLFRRGGFDMEKWDLYTKYREKTGREHIRGEKIPEGFYHLVAER